jgi:excisionase family DNA binding protein
MRRQYNREILTVEQAAEMLQANRNMIYKLIESGDLRASRVGGKYFRISRNALIKFCEAGHDRKKGTLRQQRPASVN